MKRLRLLTLAAFLVSSVPLTATPSAEARILTRQLRIQDFERFLRLPPQISKETIAKVDQRFGLEPMLDRVAEHFDASYSPEQLRAMVALFDDPNMQAIVRETVGSDAPVNKLLSEWVRQRAAYLRQLEPMPKAKPEAKTSPLKP